jgi:hypothetical protein
METLLTRGDVAWTAGSTTGRERSQEWSAVRVVAGEDERRIGTMAGMCRVASLSRPRPWPALAKAKAKPIRHD